jgi:hypothetical protein
VRAWHSASDVVFQLFSAAIIGADARPFKQTPQPKSVNNLSVVCAKKETVPFGVHDTLVYFSKSSID